MRWQALSVATMLAACGQPAEQAAEQSRADPRSSETAAPLAAPESLIGEYRVAGIDGRSLDAPFGIALSITDGQVSFEPACAAFVWSYAYLKGSVDIERRQEKRNHPPPPVCPEPVAPQLDRLATALDAVDRARRTPENGIELSGNGRSVLLFSQ
jgi:hypothetical protein